MQKYDVKDGAKVEAVNEVGSDVPVGFKISPGAKTLTFDFKVPKGKLVPDWDFMKSGRELVTRTKQGVGGIRTQYLPCMISTVDPTGDTEGEHTFSVEVIALEEKPL